MASDKSITYRLKIQTFSLQVYQFKIDINIFKTSLNQEECHLQKVCLTLNLSGGLLILPLPWHKSDVSKMHSNVDISNVPQMLSRFSRGRQFLLVDFQTLIWNLKRLEDCNLLLAYTFKHTSSSWLFTQTYLTTCFIDDQLKHTNLLSYQLKHT